MIPKFKKGDKCKIIKNLLSPTSVGDIVEIIDSFEVNGRVYYKTIFEDYPTLKGFAAESCLEKARELP